MTLVLGVSAFYHDSAVCLVEDGRIVAAAQEERFSRVVGDERTPQTAANACLSEIGARPEDVELVVFYEKPLLKLERILENHLSVAPRGLWQWRMLGRRLWTEKLGVESTLRRMLPGFRGDVGFVEHHESHAASAFFPSPFDEAAVLTIDGVGEWATACWGTGEGETLSLLEEMLWPDSLGLLYSAVTAALGFRVNRDEYKVMGLAAYGKPRFVDWLERHVVMRGEGGSCVLKPELLAFRDGRSMVRASFAKELGAPLRNEDGTITDAGADLAASVQWILEERVLAMARYVASASGKRNLCFAGGVALNCVANGRLRGEGPFRDFWIQPAAGDAGGAVGAALLGWYRSKPHRPRVVQKPDGMQAALLGPSISAADAGRAIADCGLRVIASGRNADEMAAELLATGQVVAVASGRMEFGPRALGNRSILADPRIPGVRERLNTVIKHRESFRPFAPVVLEERAREIFERKEPSPYMLETVRVRAASESGRDWRADISGALHVDGTARLQTVPKEGAMRVRGILEAFERKTGCPVLINTSYNDADMPIVATAEDACLAMRATGITYLLVGDSLVTTQPGGRTDPPTRLRSAQRTLGIKGRSMFLKLLRRGPEALRELTLIVTFALVICPMAFVHRYVVRESASSASGWRRRARPASVLTRLF